MRGKTSSTDPDRLKLEYEHQANFNLPTLFPTTFDHHIAQHEWHSIVFDGGFTYLGPYYRDAFMGHGSENAPGTIHAADLSGFRDHEVEPALRGMVKAACLRAIKGATHVFWWLDDPDSYGTLVEVGMAHALGVPIYAVVSEHMQNLYASGPKGRETAHVPGVGMRVPVADEMWFGLECAEVQQWSTGITPAESFDVFLRWAGARALSRA